MNAVKPLSFPNIMTSLLAPPVVPAKAGIQCLRQTTLDSRLRGNDESFPIFVTHIRNINKPHIDKLKFTGILAINFTFN